VAKKLYVGNLPHAVDDNELNSTFESYGDIVSARVITDRETGRSKGFGFVEFSNDADADSAIEAMNGSELGGRPLTVNEARPRPERTGGNGPRGGFGGGNKRRF